MKSFFSIFLIVVVSIIGALIISSFFFGCDKSPSGLIASQEIGDTQEGERGQIAVEKPIAGLPSGPISTWLNTAFAGGTKGAPTGVSGTKRAKIASFAILSGKRGGIVVREIVLKNSDKDGDDLGFWFQNLTVLKSDGGQIGQTIGALSNTPSAKYVFKAWFAVARNSSIVFDVFADIRSDTKESREPFVGVILDKVVAYISLGGATVVAENDVSGQAVFISEKGRLSASLDPSSPISDIRQMWMIGDEVLAIRFDAMDEDCFVSRIIATMDILQPGATSGLAASTYYDFVWYDGATALNTPVQVTVPWAGSPYIDVNFGAPGIVVAKYTSKVIRLKPRTNMPQYASSGAVFRFSVRQFPLGDGVTPGITARGATSGMALNGPEQDIIGSEFVIRANYPVIEALPLPAGQALRLNQPETVLYKWKITAQSSWSGGTGISFRKLTFRLNISEEDPRTSPLTLKNFRVRKNGFILSLGQISILAPDPSAEDGKINAVLWLNEYGALMNNANHLDTYIFVIFNSQEYVRACESVVYELLADQSGGGSSANQDGDAIAVNIPAEPNPSVVTGPLTSEASPHVWAVGGVRSFMVWTDMTKDLEAWTNGYLVRTSSVYNQYLPTQISIILP